MIELDLKQYSEYFKEYTELRVQKNKKWIVCIRNGSITDNSEEVNEGVSSRVYKNGSWGFSSIPEISSDNIMFSIKSATDNALILSELENKSISSFKKNPFNSVNDYKSSGKIKTSAEIIDFLKSVDSYILKKFPNLSNRVIYLETLGISKKILISDNSYSYSSIPRTVIYIILTLEEEGNYFDNFNAYGGYGIFEDLFNDTSDIFKGINEQYKKLCNKFDSVKVTSGLKDCILSPEVSGMLTHEAIGHTVEADFVMSGSIAKDFSHKKIGSELISITDFANTAYGRKTPIPLFTDDEGVKAVDVPIIENGVLKNYLHNKETAELFKAKPAGNSRAYQFFDSPYIRMRNTAILPGSSKLKDMIASIEDGYYLALPGYGQADLTSEFTIAIVEGYEIKNGKIGKAIKDTTISGTAYDLLNSVTMVSSEFQWSIGTFCEKWQWLPVGMGGPSIKCKINFRG